MRVFETYEEIEAYLNIHGQQAIMDVADMVLQEIKQFVQEKLYDAYSPTYYRRTGDFLRSFKVKKLPKSSSREYGFQIYIDYNEIHSHPNEKYNHYWPQHASVFKEDVSKLIPLWMDEGHKGLAYGRAIHFMDYLSRMFNSNGIVTAKLRKRFEYEGLEYAGSFTNIGMNFNFK